MSNKQPEALRLADWLGGAYEGGAQDAADELRRQHALIEALMEALRQFPEAPNPYTYRLARKYANEVIAKAQAQQ